MEARAEMSVPQVNVQVVAKTVDDLPDRGAAAAPRRVVCSHSRPHVSKTTRSPRRSSRRSGTGPIFQDRFRAYENAETFGQHFVPWYNPEHRHEQDLHRILTRYFTHDHHACTHLALAKDAPDLRHLELPTAGRVMEVGVPEVGGGLHHTTSTNTRTDRQSSDLQHSAARIPADRVERPQAFPHRRS